MINCAILTRLEAQVLLPAGAARMHRLKLVVPRRQRLVHRRPSTDATAIHVKRGSLCGGGEGHEGNLRRPIRLGLRRCRALRVTAPPGVRSLQPSAVCHQVAGSRSGAMPVARRGSGRRPRRSPPRLRPTSTSRPSTTANNHPRPAPFTKLQRRSSTRGHHGDRGHSERRAAQRARGRMKVNLAPPAEDSAQIFPPWASTIPLAM